MEALTCITNDEICIVHFEFTGSGLKGFKRAKPISQMRGKGRLRPKAAERERSTLKSSSRSSFSIATGIEAGRVVSGGVGVCVRVFACVHDWLGARLAGPGIGWVSE